MCVPILVYANWTRSYANLEATSTLLGQGCCRPAYFSRFVSLGSHCDQRVGAHHFPWPLSTLLLSYKKDADDFPSGGPLIKGKAEMQSGYMNTAYSALTGLNVIIGLFSSLAVNMPDFGRFSKNRLAGPHQFLALPIIGTLGALTPIFVTDAHSYLWGEFEWYMPAVIAKFDSRAAKFFVSASFILATIGNQVAAGTYPFSNDITGMVRNPYMNCLPNAP